MLVAPLNHEILRSLEQSPKRQVQLRRESGSPAQTTLRAQLRRLVEAGAIEKHRGNRFPGVLEYELTASGRELLHVASVLERWLEGAPEGRLPLSSGAARAAIKALAEAWSTTMLRAMAARPLSLTELSRVIATLSYPSLERRLSALRLAGLVESQATESRGTPYIATRWLRQSIAPLAAAVRWERRHRPEDTPRVGPIDVEAAFLLALPLVELPKEQAGTCRLTAEVASDQRRLAGVMVDVEDGLVTSCSTRLEGRQVAWALGSIPAWLAAATEYDLRGLELGGDSDFARALIGGLHTALFKVSEGLNFGT